MKPTIDLDAEAQRFQKMLREWLATTSRELPAAINARMFYMLLRVYILTPPKNPQEVRNKIHDYMRQPIGERRVDKRTGKKVGVKSNRVFRRQHLIAQARAKKEGKRGLYGETMRKASASLFRRAVGSVGYLKSAVVGAIKRISPNFSQWGFAERKGKNPRASVEANTALAKIAREYDGVGATNVSRMKGAKASVTIAIPARNTAQVRLSIGIADDQLPRVSAIYQDSFGKALRDERIEMERVITERLEATAQKAIDHARR